jgi:MFS family permease
VPYVVFAVTGSAWWVGIATAAQFLPGFVGSPVGGHLADTRERRTLLVLLQSVMGLAALALWWVWASGSRSLVAILGLVAVMGLVWGTTLPAWQAFVNDLVPREDLVSAVSLNSLQFNAARSLGPAIAGLVIAGLGPAWAFGLNAVSFGVVVVALLLVRTRSRVAGAAEAGTRLVAGFVEALRYVPTQPGIALVIVVVALLGLLGTPVFGFTVVFAGSVYQVGALQLGLLNTALGIGAVIAVPFVVRAKAHGGLSASIRTGAAVMGAGVVAFGLAPGVWTGGVALVAAGFGFLMTISSGNTAVQLIVAQRLRGRVMAVRLMVYMVSAPAGALLFGALSDRAGPRASMVVSGVLLLGVAGWLWTSLGARRLVRVDDPQDVSA